MAQKMGAGTDTLPGLAYVSNQGPQLPAPSYTPIVCATSPVTNQAGTPTSVGGYPDPNGMDPVMTAVEMYGPGMAAKS